MRIFLLFVFLLLGGTASAAPVPLPTDGWRMGVLESVENKGLISKISVGTLNMGIDGEPLIVGEAIYAPNGATRIVESVINPWTFFAKPDAGLDRWKGQVVVVNYERNPKTVSIDHDTDWRMLGISPPLTDPMPAMSTTARTAWRDAPNQESLSCRIVKASAYKSGGSNVYEVVVHTEGNGYRSMTCLNRAVYDFAVETLRRALPVRVRYEKLGIMGVGSFSNAGIRIVRIDCLK